MVTNQEIKEKLRKKRMQMDKKGYLICNACNSYYKLKSGENPQDFDDTCECGGKLEFHKELSFNH